MGEGGPGVFLRGSNTYQQSTVTRWAFSTFSSILAAPHDEFSAFEYFMFWWWIPSRFEIFFGITLPKKKAYAHAPFS